MGKHFDLILTGTYTAAIAAGATVAINLAAAPGPVLTGAALALLSVRMLHTADMARRAETRHRKAMSALRLSVEELKIAHRDLRDDHGRKSAWVEGELADRRSKLMSEFKLMEQVLRKLDRVRGEQADPARFAAAPVADPQAPSPPLSASAPAPASIPSPVGTAGTAAHAAPGAHAAPKAHTAPAPRVHAGHAFVVEDARSAVLDPDPAPTQLDIGRAFDAIERAEVWLQAAPVYKFAGQSVDFLIANPCLLTESGEALLREDMVGVAEAYDLVSSVDNLFQFRSVQIARDIYRQPLPCRLILPLYRESLCDRLFWPQFLEFMAHNDDLTDQVYFAADQSLLEDLDRVERAHLQGLIDRDFRLALTGAADLDFDLAALRRQNVRLVLLPTPMFPDGVTSAGAPYPATDFARLIDRHGMTLIIDDLQSEDDLLKVMDNGGQYGAGPLFGGYRPLGDDLLAKILPRGTQAPSAQASSAHATGA